MYSCIICGVLLYINLYHLNSYIFIVSTFIAAHSQLNVICGWIWQLLVEPWRSGGRGSTTISIPQRGRIKLRSWKSNISVYSGVAEVIISNS